MSVLEAMKTAIRREGIGGLYKGVGAVAGGAGCGGGEDGGRGEVLAYLAPSFVHFQQAYSAPVV